MIGNHVLLAFIWTLYGILHSVLADLAVKNFFQKNMGRLFIYYRLFYNIFAFLGLAAIICFQLSMKTKVLFAPTLFTKITGAILASAGLLLMVVCIKKYFAGLSGVKNVAKDDKQPQLIVSGVHRFVRHPLYLGTFVFIWGSFLSYPYLSLAISNSVITLYTLFAIRLEEKKLVLLFREQYTAYQRKVPKIVPKNLNCREFPALSPPKEKD